MINTAAAKPGEMWSNRKKNDKQFKNYGPKMELPSKFEYMSFSLELFFCGVPKPSGGYKAFGKRWHRHCNPALQMKALRQSQLAQSIRQLPNTSSSSSSSSTNNSNNNSNSTPISEKALSSNSVMSGFDVPVPKDYVYWLGHATILLCVKGLNIIIDPVFSERASPVQFFGPKRRYPCATTVEELPPMDIVLLTHNHYDHLDADSIKALYARFPNILMVVPLNMDRLLVGFGVPEKQIITLDWWEELNVAGVTFACVPAHHWSWHDLFDRDEILWCGWVVGWNPPADGGRQAPNVSRVVTTQNPLIPPPPALPQSRTSASTSSDTPDFFHTAIMTDSVTKTLSSSTSKTVATTMTTTMAGGEPVHWDTARTFYFTGDTAFNKVMFEQIHYRYPRIDLAALPIGAYAPREICYTEHVDPEHAVEIFKLLKIRKAFGVHWGAFEISSEPLDEPIEVLKRTLDKEGISNTDFQLIRTGDFLSFDDMVDAGDPSVSLLADDGGLAGLGVGLGLKVPVAVGDDTGDDDDAEEGAEEDLVNSFWSRSTSMENVSAAATRTPTVTPHYPFR